MKKCALILLILFSVYNIFAQSIHHISVKDGLSSRKVYNVCTDASGYLWISTYIGIDRFDGNEIRHYKLNTKIDSKDHILSSTVIQCDNEGSLWVALKNGDVLMYERKTDSFNPYYKLSEFDKDIKLYDILFEKRDFRLFSTNDGVYCIEKGNKPECLALKKHQVNSVARINANTFIAGTNENVFILSNKNGARGFVERVVDMPKKVDAKCFLKFGNKIFIGTFSDGVFVLDIKTNSVHKLNLGFKDVPIRRMLLTAKNKLLIATDGDGMVMADPVNERLINHYVASEDDDKSICGNTVSDICTMKNGGIFVSTSTNGLSYMAVDNFSYNTYRHKPSNDNSIKSNHVNVIFQDSDGDCWFGTNNGVSLFEKKKNRWRHFLADQQNDVNVVLAICQDSNGDIWVGGYGMGVYTISKNSGAVHKIQKRNGNKSDGIGTDYIYSILSDGNNVWLGGIEGELTCYDIKNREYKYFPIDCIGDIDFGDNNDLLISGCGGLGIFNKTTGNCKWYKEFGGTKLLYPIRSLIYTSKKEIWMAADGDGLIRFNPKQNKAQVYSDKDGISSNSISSLLEDNDGNIWFSTEKDLYYFDIKKNKIYNANQALGIDLNSYNSNAAFRQKDGNLLFGTAEGCLSFYPRLQLPQLKSTKLIFTDFKLSYESVKAGSENSLLTENIDDTDEISLKHYQNSFSISYSAINFTSPYRLRYEYKLENYDDDWNISNSVQSVNYANLSSGKYIFHLKAFDKFDGALIGERMLTIYVQQPFWLSWWAFLIYIVIIGSISYALIQYRKEKVAQDKIRDKIRSFISIAHDIRTPVTLIEAPLNELKEKENLSPENRESVNMAIKNAEKLMTMINGLIDIQKTEKQADELLNVSEYDVESYMKEKISEFHLPAMQKGVEIELYVQDGMPTVCIDREKMDHIVDNLMSNAVKYTENGCIKVNISFVKKRWSIEFQDNGIGIPIEDQKNIFNEFYRARNVVNSEESGSGIGLMITKRIVEQHHGEISFESIEGKGTTFVVSFPIVIKGIQKSKEEEERIDENDDEEKTSGNNKNVVLLAEDDDDMRQFLTDNFKNEYKVVAVHDGNEALEMARKINPDIVITDVVMPLLRGDELCRILKSSVETSHIPVILLTALSERENIIFGLEAGASDYIIKPFDITVLKVRIRNILQNRQDLRDTVMSMNEEKIDEFDYTSQLDKEFLDNVMKIVQEELSDSEFSINTLCRKIGMSRTSLYNKIKTLTGQGPNDFIRIVRLNKSKELLMSRKYNIGEVSSMVGFSDPKYFSTCFKKQFGISPSKV